MNTIGNKLRLTTFGESHGVAIGGVLDGMPPQIKLDFDRIAATMAERRPGGLGATARSEKDLPEFLSGISPEGITLGTPIGFIIRNEDCKSKDYDDLKDCFRPNHADFTYELKYGIRDHRGGGRASARETACRVAAGALAQQFLTMKGVAVKAFLSSVGHVGDFDILDRLARRPELSDSFEIQEPLREEMMAEILRVGKDGDSVGGSVVCVVTGVPGGLGSPLYDKLNARLSAAMMGINAAKAFEIGGGVELCKSRGSQVVDAFVKRTDSGVMTSSNFSGGVQGGISNGMPIFFRVWFKPTPTIGLPVDVMRRDGEVEKLTVHGRHDPCVALRGVAVVKAMAALTIADFMLESGSQA